MIPATTLEGLGYDLFGNADHLLTERDQDVIDAGLYVRVHGDAECPVCRHAYRHHPVVQGALWLVRGCDRLVKL